MNLSFIGCPCSGKTTTAAMVFARLKESGLPAEFVPEYARQFIAKKRLVLGLKPEDKLSLNDDHQVQIMREQAELEWTMSQVCGPEVIVVSETWSLSAMLYMTEQFRNESPTVKWLLADRILPFTDLVFYCPPVSQEFLFDPNRIHDESQSLAIDTQIPLILSQYAPHVGVVPLSGLPELRTAQVLDQIFTKIRARR